MEGIRDFSIMETTAFSDLECKFDETDVIVMDTGSGLTKVGYSGYDVPVRVIPTVAFQGEFTRESMASPYAHDLGSGQFSG